MRRLIVIAVLMAVATPALAEVRAYTAIDPDKPNGLYNVLQRSPQITPSVQAPGMQTAGCCFGSYFLEDDGLGTVTMDVYSVGSTGAQPTTLNTTGFMGSPPGAFLFVRNAGTTTTAPGQSAPGSALTSVDWGVLTGWAATGADYCRSTPPFVCTFIQRIEDGSVSFPLPSTTYDLGTWNFDAAGDFEGSPYIQGTQDGGIGNSLVFVRGQFTGASLPALPIVGLAALAGALAIAGARSALRKG
jgi:hypothetical protein